MSKRHLVSDPDEVETTVFDWGRFNVTCSPSINAGCSLSAGVVTMHPGLGHARHNHPGAEEILFVISGEGEQMIEDAAGAPVVFPVRPGSTIHVPADRYHSTLNTGTGPLSLLVVYSPAGPELLARETAGARLAAPARERDR